jgi:hypothetical protein
VGADSSKVDASRESERERARERKKEERAKERERDREEGKTAKGPRVGKKESADPGERDLPPPPTLAFFFRWSRSSVAALVELTGGCAATGKETGETVLATNKATMAVTDRTASGSRQQRRRSGQIGAATRSDLTGARPPVTYRSKSCC